MDNDITRRNANVINPFCCGEQLYARPLALMVKTSVPLLCYNATSTSSEIAQSNYESVRPCRRNTGIMA